ncbi:uncharacterized protein PHALS_14726 [Plasmopara halstedii]|uniref:Uncharacterized protein n=1 Tax=Plasmopara halstedii TaxID=4781 RepID=A0A0P1A403_PLAHL|nr:uncharacterized protein PHALS_14726 [Plasmopara halstedii]CEG35121.1 hypothetical protein PHALS_14726 [Plasmopara halstedii]|eukprot:XP_024571490.1 hypothetical protein PHALS_14726 [Plasmopara halstedii]
MFLLYKSTKLHIISWQNDEYKEGLARSHIGPCEAWLEGSEDLLCGSVCSETLKDYIVTITLATKPCFLHWVAQNVRPGLHRR